MAEVDKMGGMVKAIESGLPQRRIEEAAAIKQARIDRGLETIVGVNKYTVDEEEMPMDILKVDNHAVRESQIRRLAEIKENRNEAEVNAALEALQQAAKDESGNLLDLSIKAVRARATVGEVTTAMENVYGRHRSSSSIVQGVYGKVWDDDANWVGLQNKVATFAKTHGRKPRILVVKMGQDGHDRGAKVVATAFADAGFDVDLAPLFQTPEEVALQAIENDVHVVGVSTLAGAHNTLIPQLIAELKKHGADDVLVICGGVIPEPDHQPLFKAGVTDIFGPGTSIVDAAMRVIDSIDQQIQPNK